MARMKKLDRFDRVTRKEFDRWVRGMPHLEAESVAARLLRRQHRAVVRIVQQLRLRARNAAFASLRANTCPEWHAAKIEVLNDLLAALAVRSK